MRNYSDNIKDKKLEGGLQQSLQQGQSAINHFEEVLERLKLGAGVKNETELARILGIKQQSIAAARRRKQLPPGWITTISKTFKISADWLLYGEGPMRRGEVRQERAPSEEPTVAIPHWENPDLEYFDFVPMAEAHLSAGGGAFVLSENIKNYYAFRKDWLHKVATSVRNLVLMTVRGSSMEPTIQDGDTVLIDTGRKHIYDGCIYALGQGETISIKRLELLAGMRVRIISDNRTEFPPYEVSLRDLRILGQIIWHARELINY